MTSLEARYVRVSEDLVLRVTVERYDLENKPDDAMIRGEVTGVFVRRGKLSLSEVGE